MPEFAGRETLTIAQACIEVGVSRRTIYNWLQQEKIQHIRTASGRIRIFSDSLYIKCNRYTSRGPHVDPT